MVKSKFTYNTDKLANIVGKRNLLFIFMVVIVGIFTIVYSQASLVTSVSFEAESNTPNGNAAIENIASASNGKVVKFGLATQPSTDDLLNNFFPIGTFISPDYDFIKWKNRGVNTIVEPPQGTTPGPWASKAAEYGLRVIAPQVAGSPGNVIAWNHPDEPDGIYSQRPYTEIQQNYSSWKAINPDMPVYINFIGDLNQYDKTTGEGGANWYKKYIAGADWISADTYPVNQGRDLTSVGIMIDKLRSWSGDKPVFAFIESSDYNSSDSNPGPNPAQLRAQIWSAIIHGVRGYWYFAPRVTPYFAFDTTPSDVADEMTIQNNLVTSLTSVLQQGDINPTSLNATVPSGFEVGWRNHSSGKYFFVLNLTNSTKNNQTISLNGIGSTSTASVYQENRNVPIIDNKFTDNFAPYSVHIYRIN